VVLFESTQSRAYAHLYPAMYRAVPPGQVLILSPDWAIAANELWMRMLAGFIELDILKAPKRRPDGRCARHRDGTFAHDEENEATCARPLSGWFAALFSLFVCREVDIYGFDIVGSAAGAGENHTARYHYFDAEEGMTSTHSFDATLTALLFLRDELKVPIKLY